MPSNMRRLVHAAILAVVVMLFSTTVQQALAALTERQENATLSFLQQFPDTLASLKNSWTGTAFCSWEGVSCDANGYVSINLSGKNLVGGMPGFPLQTSYWDVMVTSIDMSNNPNWSAPFAPGWMYLSSLKFLNLSYTALKGSIPAGWYYMFALEEVYISHTKACSDLPDLPLKSLRIIDFSNNKLHGTLPASWSYITTLTSVNISGNDFCGCVSDSWSSVAVLREAVAGTAAAASDCRTANVCSFADRYCWTYATSTMSFATRQAATRNFLQRFAVGMPLLRTLWTGSDYCSWVGVTCDVDGYVALYLSREGLKGTLPDLGKLPGSGILIVSITVDRMSEVGGTLPAQWGFLSELRVVTLSETGVSGTLSDTWNRLPALETVQIDTSKLCGTLPNWNMSTLTSLIIDGNQLAGPLPASWSEMTSLTFANVDGNGFCGCVPQSWSSSPALMEAARTAVGRLTAADCATANACKGNYDTCRTDAAALPMQATLAFAALSLLLAATLVF